MLLLLGIFINTNVAEPVLCKDKVAHLNFHAWGIVPVLGIGSCLLLLAQQKVEVWLYGLVFLVVGLMLHLMAQWAAKREAAPSNYLAAASRRF